MIKKNIYLLFIGTVLIFTSLFVFTRPALFDFWNFSETGQIGDTIGGIASPIISLIGAFLVYISFQAQNDANKLQIITLAEEKESNKYKKEFDKHVGLFDEIKSRLHSLEFVIQFKVSPIGIDNYLQPEPIIFKGLNALYEYVLRLENEKNKAGSIVKGYLSGYDFSTEKYSKHGLFLNFQFMLNALNDLIDRVEINRLEQVDKIFIRKSIELFYKSFLQDFAKRILDCYDQEKDVIAELLRIRNEIEVKLNIGN